MKIITENHKEFKELKEFSKYLNDLPEKTPLMTKLSTIFKIKTRWSVEHPIMEFIITDKKFEI